MLIHLAFRALGACLVFAATMVAQITSLADFQDCIGPNGASLGYGATCELATGTYTVPFTDNASQQRYQLGIGRSNITITGAGAPWETILRRGATTANYIMVDGGGVTGVTVENLTFDGNRYLSGLNCQAQEGTYYDLDLTRGGNYTVQFVNFINAPSDALELAGTSTVSYSNFGWGFSPQSAQQTATRFTAMFIAGTYGGAYYNNIAYAGTAGMNLSGNYLIAYGNLLQNNRYEHSGGQGGQLYVAEGSQFNTVASNVVNGNNWYTPYPGTTLATGCSYFPGTNKVDGIEVYGYGHRFYNNELEQNTGSGMQLAGGHPTGQITISSSNPWNSSDPPRYIESNGGGIWFVGPSLSPFPNAAAGVTFDDPLIRNNNAGWGVLLDSVSNSGTYIGFLQNGSCMSGNSRGNVSAPGSTLTYTNPNNYNSYLGGSCPP